MDSIKKAFFFFVLFSLILTLNPETQVKPREHKKYTSSSSHNTKTPYEKEHDALKEALYCNADKMQSGDSCYCGRVSFSCCSSKDKCSGSITRSCSNKVDDFKCDNQVTQGLAYWQETKDIEKLIECSNEHYAENKPCICGKVLKSCCYSKKNCDVGVFTEKCDKKSDDASCEAERQASRKQTKPKYYTVYSSLFSFGSLGIVKSLSILCLVLIHLLKF